MAFLPEPFDPAQEPAGGGFDPIPPGEYSATVVEADVKTPRSGDGYMLSMQYKVDDGEYEGRRVFQTIVFQHSNETAQKIGRATMKSLCDACGLQAAVKDTQDFLFKPVRLKIGIEKDKNGAYDDRNRVLKILPPGGGEHAPAPPPPARRRLHLPLGTVAAVSHGLRAPPRTECGYRRALFRLGAGR
jgi:hypothetical protein